MKINSDTKVNEALKMSKEVRKVFSDYKLVCPSCKGMVQDSIKKVAVNNGLELNKFIEDLNKVL